MAEDVIYGRECKELAIEAGKKIISCKSIKCNYCENSGNFKVLCKSCELDEEEYMCAKFHDDFEPDWKAKYYYLIKCNKCNNISLCTFETNGNDEYGYQSWIEDEAEYSKVNYDEYAEKRLEAANYKVLFPLYNENNIYINKIIKDKFPKAIEIYRQAQIAENLGLNHICGIGYRKSLEFLIKDYLKYKKPEKQKEIESKFLGTCINYIDNNNIKKMAKGAAWLGNDETHYNRKWEDKDINDLKSLINLTLKWMELELKTEEYTKDMRLS